MTDAERKMKRYVNAVERRLNMPWKVRARVMSDFLSAITARREAGQSDAQIFEELGEPKKAAAELNEQMKEFTYRKSPWRFAFLGLAALAALWIAVKKLIEVGISLFFYPMENGAGSVGIIGGADGPTAIFVTAKTGINWEAVVLSLLLAVGILGFLRLRKCKKK